jgi:hypothetical protein
MRRWQFLSLVLVCACDPDLTIAAKPGADAASEVSVEPGSGPANPNDGGTGDDGGPTADSGPTDDDSGAPSHKIDGDNDFTPGQKFVTSSTSNGYEGYIAWDPKNLYVGMTGNDIGPGATSKRWVLIYLGGATGTQTGVKYADGAVAGQQPALPFAAGYHVGLKTDLSYTNKLRWDGANWVDAGFAFVPVAQRKNSFLEVAIPLSAIGNPTSLKIHVSMINEAAGSEWTYSAMPSTSLNDGPNPSYTKYFEFDLSDTTKQPNTYQPK